MKMKIAARALLLSVGAVFFSPAFNFNDIQAENLHLFVRDVNVMNDRSAIYLRWSAATGEDAETTYTVWRQFDNESAIWEVVAEGLKRHEFIDYSLIPEGKYRYRVFSVKDGKGIHWADDTKFLELTARDENVPLYTIDREYEMTLNEMRGEYSQEAPYSIPYKRDGGNWLVRGDLNKDRTNLTGWTRAGVRIDDYNGQFMPWPKTGYGTVPDKYNGAYDCYSNPGKKTGWYQGYNIILDKNRYLWVEDCYDKEGNLRFNNEIPNFDNNNAKAAERYPWAAHGLSWRGSDSYGKGETCWYITVRDEDGKNDWAAYETVNGAVASSKIQMNTNGKYGVLCVWGPDMLDDSSWSNPYGGHPFFQSFNYGAKGVYTNGYSWFSGLTHLQGDWADDNTYSIAMGENGRSYVHQYWSSCRAKSKYLAIHSHQQDGYQHHFYPLLRKDGKDMSQVHIHDNTLGGECLLWNVKGNLSEVESGEQDYARVWTIEDFCGGDMCINRTTIKDINIGRSEILALGYVEHYFGNDKASNISGPNYVIPMVGKDREDVFVQVVAKDGYPHLIYIGHNVLKGDWELNGSGIRWLHMDNTQVINLGVDYQGVVGGCTFTLGGDKFLLLASRRAGKKVMGDFTIFKLDVNDSGRNGNGEVTLTPVANYETTDPKFGGGWENVNRVFFKVYDKGDHADIYTYLPGRTVSMYNFRPNYLGSVTPNVDVRPVMATMDDSYNSNYNEQYANLNGLDANYKHLDCFRTYVDWTHPQGQEAHGYWDPANPPSERDTEWRVSNYELNVYHEREDGNGYEAWWTQSDRGAADKDRYHEQWNNNTNETEMSAWVRPIFRRKHGGREEVAFGNRKHAADYLRYEPEATRMSVEVREFSGDMSGLYRVDIYFAKTNTAFDNGDMLPVTRYELSRSAGQWDVNTKTLVADPETGQPVEGHDCLLMVGQNRMARGASEEPIVHIPTNVNGKRVDVLGNYNFDEWPIDHWNTGSKNVLSFYSTDPSVKTDWYHVRAVYGDRWGEYDESLQMQRNGIGKYADTHAQPVYLGVTTGVEDVPDYIKEDGAVEWYDLHGVRVDASALSPGVYLKRTPQGTRKVMVK